MPLTQMNKGDYKTYVEVNAKDYAGIEGLCPMPAHAKFTMWTDSDKTYLLDRYWLKVKVDGFEIKISSLNDSIYYSGDRIGALNTDRIIAGVYYRDTYARVDTVRQYRVIGTQKEVKHAINIIAGYQVYEVD